MVSATASESRPGLVEHTRKAITLRDAPTSLNPGQEWHSEPIPLKEGDDLTVRARSASRFYAGIFDRATHDRLRRSPNGQPRAFPFRFGTDQVLYERTFRVPVPGEYVVVVRRGVYSASGPVQVGITRTLGPND